VIASLSHITSTGGLNLYQLIYTFSSNIARINDRK